MADARLHALDLAWLEMEGSGPPIAIGNVSLAEGPAPADEELLGMLAERMPHMPVLQRQVAGHVLRRPPMQPSDGDALAAHLHRVRVPASPEDPAQRYPGLAEAVGRVIEVRMPDDRPPWDAWVLTGLPDERWAFVWRVHHSLMDGEGAVATLGHAFDTEPDGGPSLADAVLLSRVGQPVAAAHRAGVLDAVRSAVPHLGPAVAGLLPHRPSSLTGPVGARRCWACAEIPFEPVRAVRRALGVTVNDVVLSCVAGGFAVLLGHRREPVRGRVVRNLSPVSLRPLGDDEPGNHISALLSPLPVGVADPVERLRRIAAGARHGKDAREPVLVGLLLGAVDHAVPAPVQDLAISTAGRTLPAWFFDTITSNVPGPRVPLYLVGRRLRAMFPIIPVAGHTAITTGVFSYAGTLCVGVTGDADRAGDVDVLARGIASSADDLFQRVGSR